MTKRRIYKDVAERMLVAVRELNAALVEAHDHPQVRVHVTYPRLDTRPAQFGCEVTRITKHEIPPEGDEIKEWRMAYKIAMNVDTPKKGKRAKKAKKSPARKAT